jgi:L-fucose isomerase-like protein
MDPGPTTDRKKRRDEMKNVPRIKVGIVAVSRDCFPAELSRKRRVRVVRECRARKLPVVEVRTVVENESDVLTAEEELQQKGVNALVIYLGNFGPEGPTTLLAQRFSGPVMFAAAAEESGGDLVNGRGDALCGLLNTSYNAGLRRLHPFIPEYPVGTAAEVAAMIEDFYPVARIISGLRRLKIFGFGPRPQDFLACNAPIKPLYDLGVEIMENSELDLYDIFLAAKGDSRVRAVARDMARELGKKNVYPDLLAKLAQYEVALSKFSETHLGASDYAVFANKCWPAFEKYFGFVPCYVNSRLASRGIPVSCEVYI